MSDEQISLDIPSPDRVLVTREKKLHYKYATKQDRIEGWQSQRAAYEEWRHTPRGEAWVRQKARRQLNLCFICMTPLAKLIHVDHIFPLFLGGTSSPSNMCITHAECNMRKGAKVYMTFKQANIRRRLFNNLDKGVRLHHAIKLNPSYKPSKREARNISLCRRYFNPEQLDALQPRERGPKPGHEERLRKRHEKRDAIKAVTFGNARMQEDLAIELSKIMREA